MLFRSDFKLGESATAEPAELLHADVLVMESTFGLPKYRMPPRAEMVELLIETVRIALADGKTPVIHAYPLGKSQEVTKLLTTAGIPVLQHSAIYEISRIYEECGMPLGDVGPYLPPSAFPEPRTLNPEPFHHGHAVVTLPRGMNDFRLANLGRTVSIAPTGWAVDPRTKYRWGVDHAIPLSDHADFDQLVETVRRVNPREVHMNRDRKSVV